jgi:hypothetical protein
MERNCKFSKDFKGYLNHKRIKKFGPHFDGDIDG